MRRALNSDGKIIVDITEVKKLLYTHMDAQKIISLIDYTSLNDTDTLETITALCQNAQTTLGNVAAVCIYPKFVQHAKSLLAKTNIPVATVVNFPSGNDALGDCLNLIHGAIRDGADEIDVVMPYTLFLSGKIAACEDFLKRCRSACGNKILKVILETGALKTKEKITAASNLAIQSGADFLKTSTGKIAVGATLEAMEVMLHAIRASEKMVGCKISGGVRTVEQAEQYLALAEKIMGKAWLTPKTFRIGASQLLMNLL